jgi:hypothetical protein
LIDRLVEQHLSEHDITCFNQLKGIRVNHFLGDFSPPVPDGLFLADPSQGESNLLNQRAIVCWRGNNDHWVIGVGVVDLVNRLRSRQVIGENGSYKRGNSERAHLL